jgi:hypothetical protein
MRRATLFRYLMLTQIFDLKKKKKKTPKAIEIATAVGIYRKNDYKSTQYSTTLAGLREWEISCRSDDWPFYFT